MMYTRRMRKRTETDGTPSASNGSKRIRCGDNKINVQFRLDAKLHDILERRARVAGTSPGLAARDILVRDLAMPPEQQALAILTAQSKTLAELRKDLKVGVQAILIAAGEMDPEKAKHWVNTNFPAT